MGGTLTKLIITSLLLGAPATGLCESFFVRPAGCINGDGTSYNRAWCGSSSIDWSAIGPQDTLFLCGTFTAPFRVPHHAPHGLSSAPITLSGACRPSLFSRDVGVVHAPVTTSTPYAFLLMRRNFYRIEHLSIKEGGMLLLDSAGTVLFNIDIQDTPLPPPGKPLTAAIVDRGVSTTYDRVRIINPAMRGIDQSFRGHNPHIPAASFDPLAVTYLTKPDFQQLPTKTTIRDSYIERTGINDALERRSAVKLHWNKEVLIENTDFKNVGTSGIEIATGDAITSYPLQKAGTADCNTYCYNYPGRSCTPAGDCIHVASDPDSARDAYDLGASSPIEPVITIRGNHLFHDAPQCTYATGQTCGGAVDCPLGYSCNAGVCELNGGRCADAHYGIVVPPGPPLKGNLTIEDNSISGFAGNGILIETRWEGSSTPISILDNMIHDNWTWGIWISNQTLLPSSGELLVSGNRFEDNGTDHASLGQGGGVQLNGETSGVSITHNFFTRNGKSGAALEYKYGGLVIAQACIKANAALPCLTQGYLTSPHDVRVEHNTFVDNSSTNIMTHYDVTMAGAVTEIQGLTVRRNINVQNRGFRGQYATVSWRNYRAPSAQQALLLTDEFAELDDNLYFLGSSFFSNSRFYILRTSYRDLRTYQTAARGDERRSIHMDPQLDANLLPTVWPATRYGAR